MTEKSKKVAFYEDDYVEEFVIEETANLPEVNLSFRPLNMIQSARMTEVIMNAKKSGILQAAETNMQMTSKHIVKWDLTKPDGSLVDYTDVKELEKVDPTIMNKIAGAIRGDGKSSKDDDKDLEDAVKNL